MNPGTVEEVSKQVGTFMDILRGQPLSLALVMMNVLLIIFLFYSQSQTLTQRQSALDQIVQWQRATDSLMANCVSAEVTKMMLDNMQKITETMLSAEQKEIHRMQGVIDNLRGRISPDNPYTPQSGPKLQSDDQPHRLFEMPP